MSTLIMEYVERRVTPSNEYSAGEQFYIQYFITFILDAITEYFIQACHLSI